MINAIRIAGMAIVLNLLFITCHAQIKVGEAQLKNGRKVYLYNDKTWAYANDGTVSMEQPSTENVNTGSRAKTKTYSSSSSSANASYSSTCGATTKKGGACRRRTTGGRRCWQHGG